MCDVKHIRLLAVDLTRDESVLIIDDSYNKLVHYHELEQFGDGTQRRDPSVIIDVFAFALFMHGKHEFKHISNRKE